MNKTILYYEENAAEFCKNTLNADIAFCRNKFLSYLKPGAHILDAGCGSGRDSKAFMELGYQVTAMDASQKICEEAEKVLECKVLCQYFEEIDMEKTFDGIWACASLLHVSKEKLPEVLRRMKRALKDEGILYASFKYGEGEIIKNGRLFNNYNECTLRSLMEGVGIEVLEMFVTEDVREDRRGEKWVNGVGGGEEEQCNRSCIGENGRYHFWHLI